MSKAIIYLTVMLLCLSLQGQHDSMLTIINGLHEDVTLRTNYEYINSWPIGGFSSGRIDFETIIRNEFYILAISKSDPHDTLVNFRPNREFWDTPRDTIILGDQEYMKSIELILVEVDSTKKGVGYFYRTNHEGLTFQEFYKNDILVQRSFMIPNHILYPDQTSKSLARKFRKEKSSIRYFSTMVGRNQWFDDFGNLIHEVVIPFRGFEEMEVYIYQNGVRVDKF